MSQFFRIVSWAKYQHYKDRAPPWIKLHRELLTSRMWVELDDAGRVLAIASMMLAAATDNRIPAEPRYLKRVAYLDYDPELQPLIDCGFIEIIDENSESASTMLAHASTLQADASPEERRGEKRRDTTANAVVTTLAQKAPRLAVSPASDFLGDENENQIPGKARVGLAETWELPEKWGKDAELLGWKYDEIVKEAEKFRQYFSAGAGAKTRRTVRGWRQSWSNWLGNAERFARRKA